MDCYYCKAKEYCIAAAQPGVDDMLGEPYEVWRHTRGRCAAPSGRRLLPILRSSAARDRAGTVLQQCELPKPVCERMTGGGCGMSKKNMRRISILVTAQTAKNLERLAFMCGYREIGMVVDKLTREKMISLHTDTLMPGERKGKQI